MVAVLGFEVGGSCGLVTGAVGWHATGRMAKTGRALPRRRREAFASWRCGAMPWQALTVLPTHSLGDQEPLQPRGPRLSHPEA